MVNTEEKKLSSSEIEEMLKEAEAVHAPRRTVNRDRKKKPKIRFDRIIAAAVILVVAVAIVWTIVGIITNGAKVGSKNKENPLVCEKYPEISDVVKNYMEAYLEKDPVKRHNIIASYVDNMGDIAENDILQKEYMTGISEIECYSKEGPYENTYVVYAYYQMELKNIATSVPDIKTFYVIRDANTGNVYIHNGVSGEVSDYIDEVTKDDDVQELLKDVNAELQETINSSEALQKFFDSIKVEETTANE